MRLIRHTRASRALAAMLAALGSAGLALIIVPFLGQTHRAAPAACSRLAFPPGAGPLFGGVKTTIAGAQAAAGFPLLVPGRQAGTPQAWVAGHDVALTYPSGITITLAPATHPDARAWFHTFIAENHAAASIGQVNNQPALVITPRTDDCGTNPAWVEFDHHGIDINISSSRYPDATLLAIARSMRPRPAWNPRAPASTPAPSR